METLATLLQEKIGQAEYWSKGDILFTMTSEANTLYLMTEGTVRLYQISDQMREITVAVHGQGSLIGTSALLNQTHYDCEAEVVQEAETWAISRDQLAVYINELAPLINKQLVKQSIASQKRLTQLVFLEVSQRLAQLLLDLAGPDAIWKNNKLMLRDRISHQDLAHMVGSTRETTTKLLGDFRNRGLIDIGYRRIVLMDRDGLIKESISHRFMTLLHQNKE